MRTLLGLFLLLASVTAHGAEIFCTQKLNFGDSEIQQAFLESGVREDDCVMAQIEGAVSEGDEEKLAEFLAANPSVTYIYLNLVGGDVNESIQMGYLMREWSVLTYATGSNTCASSCVLIWLGGAYRSAGDDHLKVHRFYVLDEEFRQMTGIEIDEFYREITKGLRRYLSDMGVEADQDELIRAIMTTPPEDLRVINEASHPRLFGAPTSRDQWIRANGCNIDSSVSAFGCVTKLILRDRQAAGLLPSQSD